MPTYEWQRGFRNEFRRLSAAQQAAFQKTFDAANLAYKGYQLVGQGAREAGQSVSQFRASVEALSAGLNRQAGIDAYKTSLLDAADAIKKNKQTLDSSTRAGP